ncbi:MAG: phosphotransferase [Sedimentisphaerales bacterium]|nr:phosphotransferase [Sedimentisphaerales bacterium]
MQLHKVGDIAFCSRQESDLDYIRHIAQRVYACYCGESSRWSLPKSDEIWSISFGGRAGVLGVRIDGRVACVKLFYDERLRTKLRVALGCSKGRRAYRNGVRLEEVGISCPRMLGYAERRPLGPAMIVTELAEGYIRLDLWALEHGAPRPIVLALARFIRDLHDRGVWHTDLSPRNILLDPSDANGRFVLLDYEDARFASNVSDRRRLDNLHHLHERVIGYVSLRDRLRFLRAYAPKERRTLRNTLRRMMRKSGTRWLQKHAYANTGPCPPSGPEQVTSAHARRAEK